MADDKTPILEFDTDRTAIIEPAMAYPPIADFPKRAVITWMQNAFEYFAEEHRVTQIGSFRMESSVTPIYRFETKDGPIVLTMATVGAPASVALLEALISRGCTQIVAVGSAGGLVADLPPGSVVIPTAAIRDEGVSYHYAPAATLAPLDAALQRVVARTFEEDDFNVAGGIAWTTDAFYRETEAKVARRQAQGAVVVDMEAASLATVAAFRGVQFGQALYVADTLYGDMWDPTELVNRDVEFRYGLLLTAIRASTRL